MRSAEAVDKFPEIVPALLDIAEISEEKVEERFLPLEAFKVAEGGQSPVLIYMEDGLDMRTTATRPEAEHMPDAQQLFALENTQDPSFICSGPPVEIIQGWALEDSLGAAVRIARRLENESPETNAGRRRLGQAIQDMASRVVARETHRPRYTYPRYEEFQNDPGMQDKTARDLMDEHDLADEMELAAFVREQVLYQTAERVLIDPREFIGKHIESYQALSPLFSRQFNRFVSRLSAEAQASSA